MTIRKRLILSYIAMVLIPIILFFMIATFLTWLFFGEMADNRPLRGPFNRTPSAVATLDDREQLLSGIKFMAQYDPNRIEDIEFLRDMDVVFNQLQVGLVIVKDEVLLHASPLVDSDDLYDKLKLYKIDHTRGRGDKFNN